MPSPLLFTVLGPDRPGIVDSLSKLVAEMGGNWLESSMSRLGGHFAGIVQIVLPEDQVSSFAERLAALKEQGLDCQLQGTANHTDSTGTCYTLDLVGNDQPGIVRAISDVIARAGGNVEKFTSRVENAPMSGERLFKAHIIACFPEASDVEALADAFAEIGDELMLDLDWNPRTPS